MPTARSTFTSRTATCRRAWDVESGSAFTYDYNGNILTAGAPYAVTILAANIDEQNRPLSISRSGVTTTYRYGPSGQRAYKKEGASSAEYYIVDDDKVLAVFNPGGTVKYWNILAGGQVMGRVEASGARFYYQKDLLGSTRLAFDANGASQQHYDYYPFGLLARTSIAGTEPKEKFTGKERDAETTLD